MFWTLLLFLEISIISILFCIFNFFFPKKKEVALRLMYSVSTRQKKKSPYAYPLLKNSPPTAYPCVSLRIPVGNIAV
jgi:hypothetical protein